MSSVTRTALAAVFGVTFLIVAGIFSLLLLAMLAGATALFVGYRLTGGSRRRATFRTIDVTPMKPVEPVEVLPPERSDSR